jgi:beta-lactamase superfamily II metal-dependent hydrolase
VSLLRVTLIDVGWGDSIFLESVDRAGVQRYALIDSNDTPGVKASFTFLKRFFERQAARTGAPFALPVPANQPLFDWVLLTHAHADHGQGLKRILKEFGAKRFLYTNRLNPPVFLASLLRYARTSARVHHYQEIDDRIVPFRFGSATVGVLWPPYGYASTARNVNNTSAVLNITLGDVTVVLTGDAEADVWTHLSANLPASTRVFKVPHHGSTTGVFTSGLQTPWLNQISANVILALSSHVTPYGHPDPQVENVFQARGKQVYRTDYHYHITLETDGTTLSTCYSHA